MTERRSTEGARFGGSGCGSNFADEGSRDEQWRPMSSRKITVTVRMYDVGFGDQFLVTVRKGKQSWRMVVDSGVLLGGAARPIEESVGAIIGDLRDGDPAGRPHADVVVATHYHADHIAGFAVDDWREVDVDEVWTSFAWDPSDADAKALDRSQRSARATLLRLIDERAGAHAVADVPEALRTARELLDAQSINELAGNRLLGRNDSGFAGTHEVRFLPYRTASANTIATPIDGVTVHVLGPSRDRAYLRSNSVGHRLALAHDCGCIAGDRVPLFAPGYAMHRAGYRRMYPRLAAHRCVEHLDELDDYGILAAASSVEEKANNTSLFFVLDVAGAHFVFPGDAQQGAWRHMLDNPDRKALVAPALFYKISHHGSVNGTPRHYAEQLLPEGAYAMLPWRRAERFGRIPYPPLMETLERRGHVIRFDEPAAVPGHVTFGDRWSELTLSVTPSAATAGVQSQPSRA